MPANCPNCGAPHDISRRDCAYCGTVYDVGDYEQELLELREKISMLKIQASMARCNAELISSLKHVQCAFYADNERIE